MDLQCNIVGYKTELCGGWVNKELLPQSQGKSLFFVNQSTICIKRKIRELLGPVLWKAGKNLLQCLIGGGDGRGDGAGQQASDAGGRGACRRNASYSKQQQQNQENNPKLPQTNFQYFIIIRERDPRNLQGTIKLTCSKNSEL